MSEFTFEAKKAEMKYKKINMKEYEKNPTVTVMSSKHLS